VSAIARTWNDGDERRCTLCVTCFAVPIAKGLAFCLVQTHKPVTEEDAELFSLRKAAERDPDSEVDV
jgi:hypothetical protein